MAWRIFFTFIISLLTSFSLYAVQCSAIFPAAEPIHLNGTMSLESVDCYDSTDSNPDTDSCYASSFSEVNPVIPDGVSCSGSFSNGNLTGGTVQCFNSWSSSNNNITVSGTGTAVVYIKQNSGDITIDKTASINASGHPSKLLIVIDVGDGIFKIEKGDSRTKVNGFFYIKSKNGGDSVFEENTDFKGHLTVEENLQIKKDGTYTYYSSNDLEPGGFCEVDTPLEFSCDSTFPLTPGAFINSSEMNNLTPTVISSSTTIGGSGENHFGIINVTSGGELSFSNDFTNYYIEQINVLESSGTAILNFKAGDYYIGEFESYSDTTINVIGSGKVRIFLRDHSDFEGDTDINESGDFEQLLIYGYDKVHFKNTSSMVGFVNATGDLDIKDSTDFNGKYYAGGTLKLTTTGSVTNACAVPATPAVLIAKYKLEESSWSGSNSILDSSGNNHHASSVGSILSTLVDPVSCQAVDIPSNTSKSIRDAIDTGIDVNTLGDQGSIAFWYRNNTKWDTGSSDKVLFDASTSSGAQFLMYIWHGGFLEFEATEPNGDRAERYTSAKSFAADEWVHIAVTWDAINDDVKIYINGVSQSLSDETGKSLTQGLHPDMGELHFGDNNSTTASALGDSADGSMDEIQLFDNVLASTEVGIVYNATTTCTTPVINQCSAVFPSAFQDTIPFSNQLLNFPDNSSNITLTNGTTIPRGNNFYIEALNNNMDELYVGPAAVGESTARLYISGSANWQNVKINESGKPEDLIIVISGGLALSGGNTVINAIIYVKSTVTINGAVTVNGSISSVAGSMISGDAPNLNYDANAIQNADFNNMCDKPSIDHFEILHDGSGLTCDTEAVTIKACTNAHGGTCTESSETVTLNFKAEGVTKNTPTFIGSTTFNFNHTAVNSAVTLSLDSPSITPTNSTVCINSGNNNNSCDMNFAEAGFLITLDNHESCTTPNLIIKAVRLSDSGLDCAPAYTGDQSVDFVFNYANPSVGTKVPSLATVAMAANTITQNRTVNFDGTGTADLSFNYEDAGQIRIDVNDMAGAGLSSASVTTVVKPAKLIVSSSVTNADCASGDATCSTFIAAGAPFDLDVTATCSNGTTVTPNFEMDNIALSVNTIAPLPGHDADLGVSNIAFTNSTTGGHVPNLGKVKIAQSIDEVGVFRITATPLVSGYFGQTVATGESANIGRFTPDKFELVSSVNGDLQVTPTPPTHSFAYVGQKNGADGAIKYLMEPSFIIKAVNTAGAETWNYTANDDADPTKDFMTLTSAQIVLAPITTDTTAKGVDDTLIDLDATISGQLVGAGGSSGQLTFTMEDSNHFTYQHIANAKVAPILLTDIDIIVNSINDGEGATLADSNGGSAGVLKLDPVGVPVRFGRWNIENGYGPETEDLPLAMQIQHWNGTQFETNILDNLTTYDATDTDNYSLNNTGLSPQLNITKTSSTGVGIFASGLGEIILAKPTDGSQGQVRFIYTATPAWLKYNWSGGNTYTENPSGIAAFGLYRGNDRIISWREVGN